MKKFLIGCGSLCVIFIAIVAGLIFLFVSKASKLERSAQEYMDTTIPGIITDWSTQTLLDQASPELLKTVTPDQMARYFEKFHQLLGPLQSYHGARGGTRYTYTTEDGRRDLGEFTVFADFEKGEAEIKVSLIRHDGKWQISGFHVNSPALLK